MRWLSDWPSWVSWSGMAMSHIPSEEIAHGWVEITKDGQTLLYDPQIENYNIRAGISNDDYGAYGVRYETAHARYLKH